ncbi:MlaE family ABC transporter permease [Desulfoluna spongiiphila]|uniref:Phospholipid/cholesterol/gamma-HCH transport system permease protein n=1 Tax=Desulfoluna spongiiphila TaxID=419481 RepID=A0A1G5C3R2_9BACT|nr:ABC transporter permease [Desulfoluna spongiiphila]SCX97053.1 phospholipid/cholesterol/gamma-HCH transport system permease protein [Desulfoluna spongiiphila]
MQEQGGITITTEQGQGVIRLYGPWRQAGPKLRLSESVHALEAARQVRFDTTGLVSWDSRLAVFVSGLVADLKSRDVAVDEEGIPKGMLRLMALAAQGAGGDAVPVEAPRESLLLRAGLKTTAAWMVLVDTLSFVGEVALGLGRVLTGRGRFRRDDFFLLLQDCGASALPIVSLISLVIGVIFAFVGSVQLKLFGAQIYVADIVGLAMARELGAMMTGIIMAGRTGAAFAAQLGTMQVNEEVDALTTMGLNPAEYLVIPRMVALVLMMPLLCLYADFLGIGGGMAIGVGMLDIPWVQYWNQTRAALDITQFMHGILKSILYGVIIAMAGCYHGMRCGRSASDVGDAATRAVVASIVGIIIADGLIAVVTSIIGI